MGVSASQPKQTLFKWKDADSHFSRVVLVGLRGFTRKFVLPIYVEHVMSKRPP